MKTVIVPLTAEAKRQAVQLALANYLAGNASDGDLAVFRDHRFMKTATADQACRFIEAVTGRSVPFDLYVTWANVLRQRYLQSLSGRGSSLSQQPMEVPAPMPLFGQDDENDDRR
jgi:hypothetical protein